MTEFEVRECLRAEILSSAPLASAIYEFWVPQSNERADIVIIDTAIEAFEIKTDRDTLKRLPRQAEAYSRIFDRCHAVVADRHVEKALEMVPDWWGVRLIDHNISFTTVRHAKHNDSIDSETLVRLLWRDEAFSLLCTLGTTPDPQAGRFRLWETLLSTLELDSLRNVVRETLRQRDPASARIPSRRFTVS